MKQVIFKWMLSRTEDDSMTGHLKSYLGGTTRLRFKL